MVATAYEGVTTAILLLKTVLEVSKGFAQDGYCAVERSLVEGLLGDTWADQSHSAISETDSEE